MTCHTTLIFFFFYRLINCLCSLEPILITNPYVYGHFKDSFVFPIRSWFCLPYTCPYLVAVGSSGWMMSLFGAHGVPAGLCACNYSYLFYCCYQFLHSFLKTLFDITFNKDHLYLMSSGSMDSYHGTAIQQLLIRLPFPVWKEDPLPYWLPGAHHLHLLTWQCNSEFKLLAWLFWSTKSNNQTIEIPSVWTICFSILRLPDFIKKSLHGRSLIFSFSVKKRE